MPQTAKPQTAKPQTAKPQPPEPWGDFDYFFRGSKVTRPYVVSVRSGSAGPAQKLTTSEARVFAANVGASSGAPPDETVPLKKVGKGELVLDLARWTPAEHSPLLVQFYFEMQSASKGKAPEVDDRQFMGVSLAEPEVHSIGLTIGAGRSKLVTTSDARPGETVSFAVTAWGVQVFDVPGAPRYHGPVTAEESKRFPAGYDAAVEWSKDGELQDRGSTFELTVGAGDLGETFEVTAARTPFPLPGRPATARLVVPKVEIHGVKGETPASKVLLADLDGQGFKAHVAPAGYAGTFTWTLEGDGLELHDVSDASVTEFEGKTVRVLARRPSKSPGDHTLVLTFVSAATGNSYEARHPLTSLAWPATVRGRVLYERTWNYHDSTTPLAAVKEGLPGCRVELWGTPPGAAAPIKVSSGALGEKGTFSFESVRECTTLSLRIFLEHHTKALVRVQGLSDAHLSAPALEVKTGAVVWGQLDLDASKIAAGTQDLGDVTVTHVTFRELCDLYKSVWFGQRTFIKLRLDEPGAPAAPTLEDAKRDRFRTMGQTVVHVPQETGSVSFYSSDKDALFVLAGDYRDRCVVLHEYGHRVDSLAGPNIPNPGYAYGDDADEGHQPNSKEHSEAAWGEAFATFLSAALMNDPTYHDSVDQVSTIRLDSDNTQVGPHSEGSCQEALWRLHKVHHAPFADMWRAFTYEKRPAHTPYAFYLNWKELALARLPLLVEAYKKFNMEFHYVYDEVGWTLDPYPDPSKKQFASVKELHTRFGNGGTLAEYCEEFYNRNKLVEGNPLGPGSTKASPTPVRYARYVAPRRVQVVP